MHLTDAVNAKLANMHRHEKKLGARVSDGLRKIDAVREMLATDRMFLLG